MTLPVPNPSDAMTTYQSNPSPVQQPPLVPCANSRPTAVFDIRSDPTKPGNYVVNLYRYDEPCGVGQSGSPRLLTAGGASFSAAEVQAVRKQIAETRPLSNAGDDSLRQGVGESLFALVNRQEVQEQWLALQTDPPNRVLLALPDEPLQQGGLRDLPWELMYGCGPVHENFSGFFFQNHNIPWSLWQRRNRPWHPGTEKGPLRVLVVVCEPDTPGLLADQEVASITTGLAARSVSVHTEVLYGPSKKKLADTIDVLHPHVLHFIGHVISMQNGASMLGFKSRIDGDWQLGAGEVGNSTLTLRKPRLVVLNVCRTEGNDPTSDTKDLAQAFLNSGAGAVVAMRAEIDSSHAVEFSRGFYDALGRSDLPAIDQAIAVARYKLRIDSPVWAVPRLLSVRPWRDLLHLDLDPDDSTAVKRLQVFHSPEMHRNSVLVDRDTERRGVWWALDPPRVTEEKPKNFAVISGNKTSGKTSLALWALLSLRQRGLRVTYIDCNNLVRRQDADGQQVQDVSELPVEVSVENALDIVTLIFEAMTDVENPDHLPRGEFSGVYLPPYPVEVDDKLTVRTVKEFFKELVKVSRRCDGDTARVIFLDHIKVGNRTSRNPEENCVGCMDRNKFDLFYNNFIIPIIAERRGRLRVVLMWNITSSVEPLPAVEGHLGAVIGPLKPPGDQFKRLFREYLERLGQNFVGPEGLDSFLNTLPETLERSFRGFNKIRIRAEDDGKLQART
ncbi:CHAT domain-containing protein [Frankia sp. Cas4]|uniref:CHAT domain-containing protein n=1 Tax=Frankia sp. Cas4 TaxID=3073927 RepID=UPI002AD3879C|nr:CHAT domain-containing protein [Frankia sp. Cas4]